MLNLDVHKATTRLLRVNTLNSSGYFMYHPVITLKNSAFYPQNIFLCFVKDTGTKSDYFPTQHQQTGFYNRVRLLCGTNRIFKYNSASNQAFKTCCYHRPPTAEARFRSQVSPCEICDDKVTLGQVFLRVLQVPPVSIIPPVLQTHHLDTALTRRTSGRGLGTCHIAMPFRKSGCMHIKVTSLFKSPPLPASLLYNEYRVLPWGKGGRGVMLTTHPLLVPRLRKSSAIPPLTLWVLLGLLRSSLYLLPPSCHFLLRPQLKAHVGLLGVTIQNVVAYLRSSPEVQIVAVASHITSPGKLHRSYTLL
jgi:hypothetical protein